MVIIWCTILLLIAIIATVVCCCCRYSRRGTLETKIKRERDAFQQTLLQKSGGGVSPGYPRFANDINPLFSPASVSPNSPGDTTVLPCSRPLAHLSSGGRASRHGAGAPGRRATLWESTAGILSASSAAIMSTLTRPAPKPRGRRKLQLDDIPEASEENVTPRDISPTLCGQTCFDEAVLPPPTVARLPDRNLAASSARRVLFASLDVELADPVDDRITPPPPQAKNRVLFGPRRNVPVVPLPPDKLPIVFAAHPNGSTSRDAHSSSPGTPPGKLRAALHSKPPAPATTPSTAEEQQLASNAYVVDDVALGMQMLALSAKKLPFGDARGGRGGPERDSRKIRAVFCTQQPAHDAVAPARGEREQLEQLERFDPARDIMDVRRLHSWLEEATRTTGLWSDEVRVRALEQIGVAVSAATMHLSAESLQHTASTQPRAGVLKASADTSGVGSGWRAGPVASYQSVHTADESEVSAFHAALGAHARSHVDAGCPAASDGVPLAAGAAVQACSDDSDANRESLSSELGLRCLTQGLRTLSEGLKTMSLECSLRESSALEASSQRRATAAGRDLARDAAGDWAARGAAKSRTGSDGSSMASRITLDSEPPADVCVHVRVAQAEPPRAPGRCESTKSDPDAAAGRAPQAAAAARLLALGARGGGRREGADAKAPDATPPQRQAFGALITPDSAISTLLADGSPIFVDFNGANVTPSEIADVRAPHQRMESSSPPELLPPTPPDNQHALQSMLSASAAESSEHPIPPDTHTIVGSVLAEFMTDTLSPARASDGGINMIALSALPKYSTFSSSLDNSGADGGQRVLSKACARPVYVASEASSPFRPFTAGAASQTTCSGDLYTAVDPGAVPFGVVPAARPPAPRNALPLAKLAPRRLLSPLASKRAPGASPARASIRDSTDSVPLRAMAVAAQPGGPVAAAAAKRQRRPPGVENSAPTGRAPADRSAELASARSSTFRAAKPEAPVPAAQHGSKPSRGLDVTAQSRVIRAHHARPPPVVMAPAPGVPAALQRRRAHAQRPVARVSATSSAAATQLESNQSTPRPSERAGGVRTHASPLLASAGSSEGLLCQDSSGFSLRSDPAASPVWDHPEPHPELGAQSARHWYRTQGAQARVEMPLRVQFAGGEE